MPLSIWIAAIWGVTGCAIALLPSYYHRRFAFYLLLPTALPLLVWVTYDTGWLGLIAILFMIGSVLRWPFYFFGKFVLSKFTGADFEWPDFGQKKENI